MGILFNPRENLLHKIKFLIKPEACAILLKKIKDKPISSDLSHY
jgi:hypothetical protein